MSPRKATPKTAAASPAKKPAAKPKAAPRKSAAAESPALLPELVEEAAPKAKAAKPGKKPAVPTPVAVPAPAPLPELEAAPAKSKAKKAAPAAPTPLAEGMDPQVRKIHEALVQGKALEFIFLDGDTNPPRTFEPRSLSFDTLTKAWFVWGWDRRYNAERHHRVDLLKEVNDVEGVGRSAQGPYKEGTPSNQIGGWLGGEPIPVKATLMKQWIFAVKQAPPPFPEFRMEDAEEGKATVSFTGTDLRAIARWCMQFGDGIQVQEPQRLVDRIKQVGVTWGGKPAPAPPPPPPHQPKAAPAPAPAPRPQREREVEEKPKAPQKNPKVEVRIERL